MEDFDRNELLAAMYYDDGEEEKNAVEIEPSGFNRIRKIRVGIVEYEVPSVEYVNRIEQMLAKQARLIEHQRHQIERLQGYMLSTRNFLRRQSSNLVQMQEDIQNKMDLREYP